MYLKFFFDLHCVIKYFFFQKIHSDSDLVDFYLHLGLDELLIKVDPGKLYEDCVFDYCSCTGPKSNCFCPIFSTYGDQCTEKVQAYFLVYNKI